LRAVITEFYRRVFDDVMIGFMFAGKDQRRLIDKEFEFTARLLGANIPYTGKPIRAVHAPHRIFGGQFDRRLHILRDALAALAVHPEVQQVWIDHTIALRSQITDDVGSDCGNA
jgi:hemoglobin